MSDFDLSIVIVNYNTADLLSGCLASIRANCASKAEVIVVDNASRDHSKDVVRELYPEVKLIVNERNEGFAGANNCGVRHASGKYLFFLNPDTKVGPGIGRSLISFMESHPEVGLAGTRLINPDGSPQCSLEKRYPGQRHAGRELRGLKGEIAWVLGASMIVRRRVFEDVGGFDERFFLYGEDQDLCFSVRKAGWLIGYIPEAAVTHWGGASEQETPRFDFWRKKVAGEQVFYEKHYAPRTIHAIRREDALQAWWRIITIKLTMPFLKDKKRARSKLAKYGAVLAFLKDHKGSARQPPPSSPSENMCVVEAKEKEEEGGNGVFLESC